MSADRSLIYRAASVLEKGPMHMGALAREAFGWGRVSRRFYSLGS